jgi:stage II sporulation protein P
MWEDNFLRADILTESINLYSVNLCRPVSIKASRYNQHVSTGALLVEVGNNMNTLDEALRAVPYLARAIRETAGGYDIKIQHAVVE